MRYRQGTRRKPIEYEKDLVLYWKQNKTFEKSLENRPLQDSFVFYDGPPFITGQPHYGTLLVSIIKDVFPRYWTMKGKRVERVWGWDCHGLPAEVFTEKKLGIQDKRDVGTKISLEEYITTCRENMVLTGSLWEDTIDRIGRWVDFKGAYKTMDKDYMESVWWAFKRLYDAGKIYEGEKVLLYCVRDATPISKAEVAMDNSYKDDTDPSVYVKFKLKNSDSSLLAWTTTPWTLPANVALAVNKNIEYAKVELNGDKLILAKKLLKSVLTDERHKPLNYNILETFLGEDLVGKKVEPLFEDRGLHAHEVYHQDFVNLIEGSGIVHEAPAYGEDDYNMALHYKIPVESVIDDNGYFTSGDWKGLYVWDANKIIAKDLLKRGVVWKIEYITHSYPHCHRCGTKLMYRAHPSWFLNIADQRSMMLEQNGNINWYPRYLKNGRFAKTVESAPDWNISRDRFWATAMPIWKGVDKAGEVHIKVVGSYAELKKLSGVELDDYHRPWIDNVKFEVDGIKYSRIDKVLDSWFESGSMPFAQFHYPFKNVEKFELNFPGDFVTEYIGQTRAWFYYLHAVSVGLFSRNAFNNVLVTGTLAGNDGRKMSKNFGNYTDPNVLMDEYSADALRYLLLSSPLLNGEDYSLIDKDVSDVFRKLNMIWNMYDFFTLYAAVDNWEWDGNLDDPLLELENILDVWIVSRVHQLNIDINKQMLKYNTVGALEYVMPFIDDASNWYVRRSRRRFWKSEDDLDKKNAYKTLHYVLVHLSMILSPFVPFLSEELYQKLTGFESVHLCDWPEPGRVNTLVLKQMSEVRHAIEQGLSSRAAAKIKVRQPLNKAELFLSDAFEDDKTVNQLTNLAKEELNVKNVIVKNKSKDSTTAEIKIDLIVTQELYKEGLTREVIRLVQNERKKANFKVSDRILLSFSTTDSELRDSIEIYKENIAEETLANEVGFDDIYNYHSTVNVEGSTLAIYLKNES